VTKRAIQAGRFENGERGEQGGTTDVLHKRWVQGVGGMHCDSVVGRGELTKKIGNDLPRVLG
jgi:hypothetical protein